MLSPVFLMLLAVAPGIVAWWTSRRLVSLTDDPALPELLHGRRQRLVMVSAASIAFILVFGGRAAYWAIPLMGLATIAGGYTLRRTLALETGGFAGYLWRGIKSVVGGLGFWILLVLTPTILLAIPARYEFVAVVLLVLLLAWEEWYPRIWLRLHEAVPLVHPDLAPRIDAILQRAGIAPPKLYAIGSASRMVNAFAFPSLRYPSIAFGAALVELLDPDEAAAIYAHELSHIEQYSPRRLRRLQGLNRLLIVLAVALPLVVNRLTPQAKPWVAPVWPLIVLATLFVRTRKRQHDETESDLRAAEWCGDAELVARALIKVHFHALIPRRWPIDFERRASHPSLARRIQALRGEGAQVAAAPVTATVLPTAREGTVVVFDDARAYWFDGVSSSVPHSLDALRESAMSMRSVAWSELVELRVTATQAERTLRAVHRNGDTWQVPLESSQVADVQRALDRIDLRLRRELTARPRATPKLVAALIGVSMIISTDMWLLLVPVALALYRPSTAALGALGVMAAARAAMQLPADSEPVLAGIRTVGFSAMGVLGVVAAVLAFRRMRRERKRDGIQLTVVVLGALSVLLVGAAVVAARELSASELADLPMLPALAVTLLGVAAACVTAGGRVGTVAAGASVVAAALAGAGQRVIALRLPPTPMLSRISATATEIGRVQLSPGITSLRLSPDGSRFVVQRYTQRTAGRGRPSFTHVVGNFDGQRRDIDAVQVEFVDDEHVLTLHQVDQGYELKLERADRDSIIWAAAFPNVDEATLTVSSRDHAWTVLGFDNTDSMVVISGTQASPASATHRFVDLDSLNSTEKLVFHGGSTLLVPVFDVRRGVSMPLAIFGLYPMHTELWQVTSKDRRRVGSMNGFPTCSPPDGDRTVCFTRRRDGGEIWMVDVRGTTTSLGKLRGSDAARVAVGPGLRLTFAHATNQITEVDGGAGRTTEVRLPNAPGYVLEARAVAGRLVVLRQDTVSTVTLYRVE